MRAQGHQYPGAEGPGLDSRHGPAPGPAPERPRLL